MADAPTLITIPRELLRGALLDNAELARVYLLLLSDCDRDGWVKGNPADISRRYGIYTVSLRPMLEELTKLGLIRMEPMRIAVQQPALSVEGKALIKGRNSCEVDFAAFRMFFNNAVKDSGIPRINGMSEPRKRAVRKRIEEYGKHIVSQVVTYCADNLFLNGSKTDWHANFDWIFKKSNFDKIIEGTYGTNTDCVKAESSGGADAETARMARLAAEVLRQTT